MPSLAADTLLKSTDPAPVEILNPDSRADVFLLCEHAGRSIPDALGTLGVSEDVRNSHCGWDVGAEGCARRVADLLQAPLVIQRYSRLVIDCNRPPLGTGSIPVVADGADIPGNREADPVQQRLRVAEIFEPFDQAVVETLDMSPRRAAFSIHSFTPRMDRYNRPWHAGFVSRRDLATANTLMSHIARAQPDFELAINQPYQIDQETDWFIPQHAEPRGLRHCLIEIRNDQIRDDADADLWAGLLANAISSTMEIAR